MSEEQGEHTSPIKTPKQLIVVVLLSFLVPITAIVLLTQLVTTGPNLDKSSSAMSEAAVAERLKPVGELVIGDPNAPKIEKSGEEVVKTICSACHTTGALNAPKMGDKGAWGPRIATGLDKLTSNALKGIRQMPARGGNASLSDAEISRAVIYLANQSGANFKEPKTKP